MELNTAYDVVHASNRRETQSTDLQENIAYNVNQRCPTQLTDEDNEYSTIENTEYIEHNTIEETKSTDSVLDNKSSTMRIRQELARNECGEKRFAILVIVAFVLSLLVAVTALVYTNIELKDQMISTNKQIQSMREQLNNQSSQFKNLQSIIAELGPMAFYPGTRIGNPASSCSDIPQDRPSGEYWIATDRTSSPVQVYCDMNRTSCSCNTTGGWMRVANLDMTDPNQNCPEGLRLITRTEPPLRTCGRMEGPAGCTSTTYSTYGVEYSKVCGRTIAYQSSTPDAFNAYFYNRASSIDDVYVDGVSLTYGQSPRQHIWTFVNSVDETTFDRRACPCTKPDHSYAGVVPPFIGQDYFCATGSRQRVIHNIFYPDDPLWDGQGCGGTSICCEFNNPPWFCKQLPQPTTDDIELRICGDEDNSNEDTPIAIVDMYVH